ncbi:winged helix-turn-helix domain-containing protein [Sphaerotilus montanus]|uniref:winged helix-turn-helix domain-containing protein n=1 Tax=Sphaerotilus montanus TaxID=522889 RepID=UPI003FA22252
MHEPAVPAPRPPHRTVLVVVEEAVIRELLAVHFRFAGFFPMLAASSVEARRLAGEVRPDVVLVDPDVPATADTGFAAEAVPPLPLVLVSAQAVAGCNAVLRLRKPSSPRELVGEVVRLLRRDPQRLRAGPIVIDAERHLITVNRQGRATPIELAPVELKLLQCLMARPDHAIERQHILSSVWGKGSEVDVRTVDQNIKRLRRCLEEAGAGDVIRTVRGVGYRFSSAP